MSVTILHVWYAHSSRCAMLDWSVSVFRWRNVTRRRISNTVLQPRYWGREADSPEVCQLMSKNIGSVQELPPFKMIKSKFPSCFRIFPNNFIRNSELYLESPKFGLSFFMSEKVRKFELCNFLCQKKCGKLDFIIFIGKKSSESWTLSFLMLDKVWKVGKSNFFRPEENIFLWFSGEHKFSLF
jgi:hypothetical protein